jgi:hypothetical protein
MTMIEILLSSGKYPASSPWSNEDAELLARRASIRPGALG